MTEYTFSRTEYTISRTEKNNLEEGLNNELISFTVESGLPSDFL